MDPLSITASATAILQLTQGIIVGTNNLYKSAIDCPAEIRGLLDELLSFEKVLGSLQLMVEKANGVPVSKLFFGYPERRQRPSLSLTKRDMVVQRLAEHGELPTLFSWSLYPIRSTYLPSLQSL